LPSQISAAGTAAVHGDQPLAEHVSVPRHIPNPFVLEQLRIAPPSSALHEQLPVTGWQYLPGRPVAGAQV